MSSPPPSANLYRFATTRPAPPPLQKATPADPNVFLPGNEDRLKDYLAERANNAKAAHRSCLDRMENRYPRTSQILPPAEQIRRSQESQEMLAACNRQAESELTGVMDEFRNAVTGWAARQPASYEGLRALNSADSQYRFLGSYWRPDSPPYALASRIPPMIAEVFGRRRAEIEPLIRPMLQAEVLRTQSLQLVADLFNRDDKMIAPYRSVLNAQQTAAAEADALRKVPAGPNGELALAATAAFGRAPRIAMGQSLGATTVRGTTIVVNAAVLTENYEFGARNAQCSAPSGGKTTCSYDLEFRASGTLLGAQFPTVSSGWIKRRDVFYWEAGKLRSAELDQDMARLAEASKSNAGSGPSLNDMAAERRRQDCRQQMFSSYMSGDYGSAAATGIAGCQ